MKLTFLGTGAADWSLAKIAEYGWGRRFSSALVNGDLLIDPGPHIYDFEEKQGTPGMFRGVTNIIVTHSHGDHFNVNTLRRLCSEADGPVTLYGDAGVLRKLEREGGAEGVTAVALTPCEAFECGGYEVTPCRSNHDLYFAGEQTLNYIVREKETGRSFFYGADSGWIVYDTWLLIKRARPNAVIFEATIGNVPGDDRVFGHTSIPMIAIMIESMRAQHGPADDCRYYTTHMARTLHGTHDETVRALEPLGVTPAYDGMIIEI